MAVVVDVFGNMMPNQVPAKVVVKVFFVVHVHFLKRRMKSLMMTTSSESYGSVVALHRVLHEHGRKVDRVFV